MELPLDHFRLIGVNPSATSEEILRSFQLRLDKTPDEGFSYEVLTQRSELLRLTADLLTNTESRQEYDKQVLNGASGLEFSSNREVAGLILLWESGAAKETFKLARQALQPPQTPALGSTREADLTLLAALTSRDAAIQEQDQRCYANAADFLQEGIQILQRMGKLSDLRKNLEDDLASLLPYRILDFLSRDLNDYESHKKGISLLQNLIIKRGGLEGKNKSEYINFLNQNEFEVFFEQIKPFLTVQEQIDLFSDLYKRGSLEAGFELFIAITAMGFSQKKPEKLFEAKKLIKNLKLSNFDSMPLIGCLDLLLADIKQAEARFLNSSDDNLRNWFKEYEGEKLEAICLYCQNWLENEVLQNFRDINIQDVNLDLWFNQREIQDFIEKIENKSKRVISKANFSGFGKNLKNTFIKDFSEVDLEENSDVQDGSKLPVPGGIKEDEIVYIDEELPAELIFKNKTLEIYNYCNEKYTELKYFCGEFIKNSKFIKDGNLLNKSSYLLYFYTFSIVFFLGISSSFLRTNFKNNFDKSPDKSIDISEVINDEKNNDEESSDISQAEFNEEYSKNIVKNKFISQDINSLNELSPNLDQIQNLLESWLMSKSKFLSGDDQLDISKIVKRNLILRLKNERQQDIKNNITKDIKTEVQDIEFLSQSSSRISVSVKLKYSEKIINANGELISETSFKPFLKVKYILGFSNKSWKLVDYVSGV